MAKSRIEREIDATMADPEGDSLAATLLPVGRSPAIGAESGRAIRNGVGKHVSPHGSIRYLRYVDGKIVSGLQVVSADGHVAKIANVYTLPGYRGRGMAAELLARARRDFRDVRHADEDDLSPAGRGWRDKMEAAVDPRRSSALLLTEVPRPAFASRKSAGRRQISLRVTAKDLIRAVYGQDVAYANRGVYPGTSTPLRKIRGDEVLRVDGTSAGARVMDDDGGWIADRVGDLGARQISRLLAFLGK
jgi:GNAT superfamily N-acetyltransferase